MSPHGHAPLIGVSPRFACTGIGWHRRETRSLPASLVAATEYKGSGPCREERRGGIMRAASAPRNRWVSHRHGPQASSRTRVTACARNVTSQGQGQRPEHGGGAKAMASFRNHLRELPGSWHVACSVRTSHVAFPPITWRGWQQGGAVRTQQPRSFFPADFLAERIPRGSPAVLPADGRPPRDQLSPVARKLSNIRTYSGSSKRLPSPRHAETM
jgi:hypothetical protein